jgi:hypothetical protein
VIRPTTVFAFGLGALVFPFAHVVTRVVLGRTFARRFDE